MLISRYLSSYANAPEVIFLNKLPASVHNSTVVKFSLQSHFCDYTVCSAMAFKGSPFQSLFNFSAAVVKGMSVSPYFIIAHTILSWWKRGSLVVSALAISARGHGFDPRGRRGKISVSEHAFLSVICRDDTK